MDAVHRLSLDASLVAVDLALEETTDGEADLERPVLSDVATQVSSKGTLNGVAYFNLCELPTDGFVRRDIKARVSRIFFSHNWTTGLQLVRVSFPVD